MKRHPTDPLSLVMGIVLLTGAGMWLAWDQGNASTNQILIAIPIALIAGGIVGIIWSAIVAHHRKELS